MVGNHPAKLQFLRHCCLQDMKDPEVSLHCLYSLFGPHSTSEVLDFRSSKGANWYDNEPVLLNGEGDGTVNLRSLEACKQWKNVKTFAIPKTDHLGILHDQRTLQYIHDVLISLGGGDLEWSG